MSDLQIILIVIGALIICAVVIINWWQERRFHKQVENSFSNLKSDALLDDPELDVTKLNSHSAFQNLDSAFQNLDDADGKDFSIDKTAFYPESEADSAKLNHAFQEDNYVTNRDSDAPHHNNPPSRQSVASDDEESLDAVYTQLVQTKLKSHGNAATKFTDPDEGLIKSEQHDEIAAIFNKAFNQTAPSTHQHQEDEPAPIPTSIPAQEEITHYSDVKVVEPTETLPAVLHSQIDLSALLYLAHVTPLDNLKNALATLLQGHEKQVFVHVLDEEKVWHDLDKAIASLPITRVACSLQLADRGGPVSRLALNRFQLAVETIGLDMNAHVEWQNPGDPYTNATGLDNFCIEVDKTMGFHLLHGENGAFTGTKLRGLAEAQGLTIDGDGSFKFYDEPSHQFPAFVMVNRDDYPFNPEMLRSSVVKSVTFQLDIPHVKQCAEAFTHMIQIARQMEIGLNATLVDDNNKVLGDIQIEKIRQQLKVIHATMLVRGIPPGSDSAHRLFS